MANCTIKKAACPPAPVPSTALTSWETTVGVPAANGTAWVHLASSETPSTKKARIELMVTKVIRAFLLSGLRNEATPLEMASRPVSDEPPLANARRSDTKARPIRSPEPCVPNFPSTSRLCAGILRTVSEPAKYL